MPDERSSGRRKSRFEAVTAVPAGAYQDLFMNGVNVKISYENYLAGLGVSGSIVQAGNVLGTPVLDIQGTVNAIRNIEDGSGIKSSISIENGLTLEHNFSFSTVGASLAVDPTAAQVAMRSVVGSDGINVSQSGEQIQVALVDAPQTTKTVIVNSIADLPTPDAGVITLVTETLYLFVNDVDIGANVLEAGGPSVVIDGGDVALITLTSSTAGDLITSNGYGISVKNIMISAATARVFNVNDTLLQTTCTIKDVTITVCDKVGIFDGVSIGLIADFFVGTAVSGGIEFANPTNAFIIDRAIIVVTAGDCLTLGNAVFGGMTVSNCLFRLEGTATAVMSGLANSGNVEAIGSATFFNNRMLINSGGTELVGITNSDDRWEFLANDDIADTRPDSLISLSGNATQTLISGVNIPTMVAGTWVPQLESQIAADAAGRSTYTGGRGFTGPIDISFSLLTASGGDKQLTAYIAINGVVVPETGVQTTASSSKAGTGVCLWQHIFVAGDYVELFVENNSNTDNIIVNSVHRIN